jgi:hypothetical protein
MKREKTMEQSIDKIESVLLKKYPDLVFTHEIQSPREATIYFNADETEDWFAIIERAGGTAVDILVDYGYWIHLRPRFVEAAKP